MEFQLYDKQDNYQDISYNSIIISLLIIYSTAISVIMFIKEQVQVIDKVKVIDKVVTQKNDEEENKEEENKEEENYVEENYVEENYKDETYEEANYEEENYEEENYEEENYVEENYEEETYVEENYEEENYEEDNYVEENYEEDNYVEENYEEENYEEENYEEEKLLDDEEELLLDDEEELLLADEEKLLHAHYIKFNHNANKSKYNASIYNTEERENVLKYAYEFNVVNALNDWRDAYEEWWDYGKKPTNLIITVQHSKESDKYIDDENIKILINNLIYEEYTFQLANKEKQARVELFKAIEKDKVYNKLRKGIEPNYLKPAYNMLSNFHRIKKDGRILQRNTYK